MKPRVLGAILFFGSLVATLNSFRGDDLDMLGSAALVLWSIGGVCGIIGLIRLNVLGPNAVARAFGFLPILGFLVLILGEGLSWTGFSELGDPLNNSLAAIGWVAVLAGMLVVGILTIAAKTWSGWRRFVPLLTVVIVPIAFGIGQAVGSQNLTGVPAFAVWMLLGYVIATVEPASALQQSLAA